MECYDLLRSATRSMILVNIYKWIEQETKNIRDKKKPLGEYETEYVSRVSSLYKKSDNNFQN